MARMIKVKLIMELRDPRAWRGGRSPRPGICPWAASSRCSTSQTSGESRGSRSRTWAKSRSTACSTPERNVRESVFEELDWSYVHTEMAKVGVNLRLLHDEYKVQCAREHKAAMGYTRFCGPQGRPQGRRVDAVNLPLRRAHRHGPVLRPTFSQPVADNLRRVGHRV